MDGRLDDERERERAEAYARHLERRNAETYPSGTMRRSVQAKNHGAVRAEFVIGDDLDPQLRVGLFARPGRYPAWIRFANQASPPRPDRIRDIRGMSIKVCGVEGAKLYDEPPGARTVDFILISSPVFVTASAEDFFRFRAATQPLDLRRLLAFVFDPRRPQLRAVRNAVGALRRHASPLEVRYFSATPYRFGATAAKYSAVPHRTGSPLPRDPSDDYLREAMAATLGGGDAAFDFCVQLRRDDEAHPIEDAGRLWDERSAPFARVATIRIPSQVFDSPEQMAFCENLAFNPWRTLEEHRPLGGVNRARRAIYARLADQRRRRNGAAVDEPTGHETFPGRGP